MLGINGRTIWILCLLTEITTGISNEIMEQPKVKCGVDGVVFEMETREPFKGQLYVKNEYKRPECRANFDASSSGRVSGSINGRGKMEKPSLGEANGGGVFQLHFNECGMRRQRLVNPKGMAYTTVMVVQFHDTFVTSSDKAYQIRCFYREHSLDVTAESMNISPLTTELMEVSHPVPKCVYGIRHKSMDGPRANHVTIGDPVVHLFKCDSDDSMYKMLIKDCYVDDGKDNKQQIIDEFGCTIDDDIVTTPEYTDGSLVAFAEATVFKWPDEPNVYFTCQLTLCTKEDPSCLTLTPPDCSDRRRKKRSSSRGIKFVSPKMGDEASSQKGGGRFLSTQRNRLELDLEVNRLVVHDIDELMQQTLLEDSISKEKSTEKSTSDDDDEDSKEEKENNEISSLSKSFVDDEDVSKEFDVDGDMMRRGGDEGRDQDRLKPTTTTATSKPTVSIISNATVKSASSTFNFHDIPMTADLVITHPLSSSSQTTTEAPNESSSVTSVPSNPQLQRPSPRSTTNKPTVTTSTTTPTTSTTRNSILSTTPHEPSFLQPPAQPVRLPPGHTDEYRHVKSEPLNKNVQNVYRMFPRTPLTSTILPETNQYPPPASSSHHYRKENQRRNGGKMIPVVPDQVTHRKRVQKEESNESSAGKSKSIESEISDITSSKRKPEFAWERRHDQGNGLMEDNSPSGYRRRQHCYGPEIVIALGVIVSILAAILIVISVRLLWPVLTGSSSSLRGQHKIGTHRFSSSMISSPSPAPPMNPQLYGTGGGPGGYPLSYASSNANLSVD